MEEPNYYQILGVHKNSNTNDIKKAFRKLARKYHPDTNKETTSKDKFAKIVEAYDTLSDINLRREYDHIHFPGKQDTVYEKKQRSGSYNDFKGETGDRVADMLRSLRNKVAQNNEASVASAINRLKGAQTEADYQNIRNFNKKKAGPLRRFFRKLFSTPNLSTETATPNDRDYSFTIDALESIRGTTRELMLMRDGLDKKIRVSIPPFISDNAVLKVLIPAEKQSDYETVFVHIRIVSHSLISRDNNDIYISLPITIGESLVGGEIDIPTLDTPVKLKLTPLTNIGKKYRLRGKGVKNADGNIGDLYVIPKVVLPSAITPLMKQAASAIDQEYSTPVRKELPTKL